mgnify:FL=1
MTEKLKIGLDLDDTLVDFWGAYIARFGPPKEDYIVTRNVYKLRKDKDFWENLKKLRDIDFIPELYCTKRINSKKYTINSLKKHDFPSRPIYQMYYQKGNKANFIKGKVDIFIDDSVSNFLKLMNSGIPCLLIDSSGNQGFETPYRIYDLNYETILNKYNEFRKSNY